MVKYTHIFFDLDHTLWDFETNSRLTLREIYTYYNFNDRGVESPEQFIEIYEKYNLKMWADYRNGKMSKETLRTERFRQSLSHLGVKDRALSMEVGDFYVDNSPIKTALFPGAIEVLEYLKSKYTLHIITNGFEEIQTIKLDRSGLMPFFNEVITSEQAGSKKPHPAIFEYAMKRANAEASDSLMVGDNQVVDVEGAQKLGMHGVLFNPNNDEVVVNPTYTIAHLAEMRSFL